MLINHPNKQDIRMPIAKDYKEQYGKEWYKYYHRDKMAWQKQMALIEQNKNHKNA